MKSWSRGARWALIVALGVLASPAAAAPFVPRHAAPQVPDLPAVVAPAHVAWDNAMINLFGWSFASNKISTACATGRGDFAASVAEMACGVTYAPGGTRKFATVSFFGPGDGDAPAGGPIERPFTADASVVPLPAAAWMFLSAVGGLAILRRRRG